MSDSFRGPSLFYVSDKNIYDALNQSRVGNETIRQLFERRNIVCSTRTSRERLALYFSSLTHDYFDHLEIAAKLGIASRRERVTFLDVLTSAKQDEVARAVETIKDRLAAEGSSVQVDSDGDVTRLRIQYTEIDYRRNEFSQLQNRDGEIELVREGPTLVARCTQAEYIVSAREALFSQIEAESSSAIARAEISLATFQDPETRSKFLSDLSTGLVGYTRKDVTHVYVYKAEPEAPNNDEDETNDGHIERITLRGVGITRQELLTKELLDKRKYHVFRIGWVSEENYGEGHRYHIEAMFGDPKDCTEFSFLLKGVYPLEPHGKHSIRSRTPTHSEIKTIAKIIEHRARDLMALLSSSP